MFVRALGVSLAVAAAILGGSSDPFASVAPTLQLTREDREQLDDRRIVVKILPAENHELAVAAAASLNSDADTLITSVRHIANLKRSRYVPQIHRISPQPNVDDFRELTLDAGDAREISRCRPDRPDRCDLKLSSEEITRLRAAGANVEDAFRRVLVERAKTYLRDGERMGAAEFGTLLQHSTCLQHMPHLARHLEGTTPANAPGMESFLYWSKEEYAWKPMISITHVTILRGDGRPGSPDVVIGARDIFSTRYTSASLTLTLLVHDDADPGRRYLVYVNRTWVDDMPALWRFFAEHRIKSQAKTVFAAVRDRIERGDVADAAAERD